MEKELSELLTKLHKVDEKLGGKFSTKNKATKSSSKDDNFNELKDVIVERLIRINQVNKHLRPP